MKQRKYIISSIAIILIILATISFTIMANAENGEVPARVIEDERTIVKISASHSIGKSSNQKVEKATFEEELNKYAGSGKTTVTEKNSSTLAVTFTETGNEYEINLNKVPEFENIEIPSIEYTMPYLPSTDFLQLDETSLSTGLVIQDGEGNQYVWIEVPKTTTVYDNLNYDLDTLTGTALTNAYIAIETDLKEYTSLYRNGTTYEDIHSGNDASTGLTSSQYTELKHKMLKSVYENGGFYIGRYEAGISTNRTSHSTISSSLVPTSKANQYPLTWIYCSEAQTLASRVLTTGEHTSSLMFGIQWDLVLKYLETKNVVTQTQLNENSMQWGNYINSTYTLNRGKYARYGILSTWSDYTTDLTGVVENRIKQSVESGSNTILYTTGSSDRNSRQKIYDLAGNVSEWTLEYTSNTNLPCAGRGGVFYNHSSNEPASFRYDNYANDANFNDGFRVSIF